MEEGERERRGGKGHRAPNWKGNRVEGSDG